MTTETETRDELLDQLAELEAGEPECECTQTDVDEFDPSYCDYHRGDSDYNRAHDRLEAAIERLTPKQQIAAIDAQTARIRAIREEIANLPDFEVA